MSHDRDGGLRAAFWPGRLDGCGWKLTGDAKGNGRFDYVCKQPISGGGCGKVCGSGIAIDRIVTQLVHAYFAEQHIEQEMAPWSSAAELEALNSVKTGLLDQFHANPDMGKYIWPEIHAAEAKIADLTKARASHNRQQPKARQTSVIAEWDDLGVDQQRAIAEELFEAVVLAPAKRVSNRFDELRLSVVWRKG